MPAPGVVFGAEPRDGRHMLSAGSAAVPAPLPGSPCRGRALAPPPAASAPGFVLCAPRPGGLPGLCRAAELPPQVVASGLNKENGDYGMNDAEGDIPTGFLRRWCV